VRNEHALEGLRALLARDGVLWSTPEHPIRHRDGSTAPWMFYSWNVTMTGEGLQLAARALLDRLAGFESTQLAAHGMTGLPLMSACVAGGAGRYTGLAIRKERKNYLSGRRIEGPGDRTKPVVVIDDSLSSGTALADAIRALEADGYSVEGAIAVVGFPGRGGLEWASTAGYRVEVLLDVESDLGMELHRHPPKLSPVPSDPNCRLPDGLHPTALARRVAEHWLRHGTQPVPPATLDDAYDATGGVFVSFRRIADDGRLARDGLWHLAEDGPTEICTSADVVAATIRTLRLSARLIRLDRLPELKIAVTFMGRAEAVLPSELDYRRYAIVCTDRTGARRGGALPNTQVFTNEAQQYRHALTTNARINRTEAHTLYRQTVRKVAEPGAHWHTYGQPDGPELDWVRVEEFGRQLTDWATATLHRNDSPVVTPKDPGVAFEGAAVALYSGRTLGVGVAWGREDLADLVARAARDAGERAGDLTSRAVAVSVSVLFDREDFGTDLRLAAMKVRPGLDTLRADTAGSPPRIALPGAAVYNGWSKQQLAAAVTVSAERPRLYTFRTASWLRDSSGVHLLEGGFPARPPISELADPVAQARALAEFTQRNLSPRAVPVYALNAVTGEQQRDGTAPRLLHALCGLYRAGVLLDEPTWHEDALRGVDTYLTGRTDGPSAFHVDRGGSLADAVLLATFGSATSPLADRTEMRAIGRRLVAMVRSSGAISPRPVSLTEQQDAIFLPGAVLAALGTDPSLIAEVPDAAWRRALAVQRARFLALQSWGVVGWSAQGWNAVHRTSGDPDQASFVLQLADWAIDRQVRATGAFLEDLSLDEPSFNTGFIGEGVAAAWSVAARIGDGARVERYRESWLRGNAFMRRLQVLPADRFICADPGAALGGVRIVPSGPWIRADSVSHWLSALCTGLELDRHARTTTP
jgi:orotate phosphoribosyltransferase